MSADLILRSTSGGTNNTVKNAPLTHAELDQNFINLDNEIDAKASLTNAALTGMPTAPTAAPGTNTDQIATTAYALNAYTHPANHPASIITQDASNRFVTDAEKAAWNAKQDALASGINIKSVNGASLLGSGDLVIAAPAAVGLEGNTLVGLSWFSAPAAGQVLTTTSGTEATWQTPAAGSPVAELLTSGTSWVCPAGVFSVKVRMVGGGGGGCGNNSSTGLGSGDGAGGVEFSQTVSPGTSYSYTIGAAGVDGNVGSTAGTAGGDTTIFGVTAEGGDEGTTDTARGIPGGVTGAPAGAVILGGGAGLDSRATNGDIHAGGDSMLGIGGLTQGTGAASQRRLPQGYGAGGARRQLTIDGTAQSGTQGCIILEYTA